jgi:hypothetical protein
MRNNRVVFSTDADDLDEWRAHEHEDAFVSFVDSVVVERCKVCNRVRRTKV